ncbi:MAG: HD domain-containing protein, partial [Candidatus Omnitrophica bacterium]|nr:HD domain-containing protein [Candidatus Omnitrophota bacterium]
MLILKRQNDSSSPADGGVSGERSRTTSSPVVNENNEEPIIQKARAIARQEYDGQLFKPAEHRAKHVAAFGGSADVVAAAWLSLLEDAKMEGLRRRGIAEFQGTALWDLLNGFKALRDIKYYPPRLKNITFFGDLWKRAAVVKGSEVVRNQMGMIITTAANAKVLLLAYADKIEALSSASGSGGQRERILYEILEVYIPLAERLGRQDMADFLRDEWLYYTNYREYTRLAEALKERTGLNREQSEEYLALELRNLIIYLKSNIPADKFYVTGRLKGPASLGNKMTRKGVVLDDINDLFGFRLVILSEDKMLTGEVIGLVDQFVRMPGRHWMGAKPRSRIKGDHYEGVHIDYWDDLTRPFEIQIMTAANFDLYQYSTETGGAHWIYNVSKEPTLSKQRFRDIPGLKLSGNFAKDFEALQKLEKQWIHVTVNVDEGEFVPLRLPLDSMPRDITAHRYIDLSNDRYAGVEILAGARRDEGFEAAQKKWLSAAEPVSNGLTVRVVRGKAARSIDKNIINNVKTNRARLIGRMLGLGKREHARVMERIKGDILANGQTDKSGDKISYTDQFLGPMALDLGLKNTRELLMAVELGIIAKDRIKERAIKIGEQMLKKRLTRLDFSLPGTRVMLERLLGTFPSFRLKSVEDLYALVGTKQIDAEVINERFSAGNLKVRLEGAVSEGRARLIVTGRYARPDIFLDVAKIISEFGANLGAFDSDETKEVNIVLEVEGVTPEKINNIMEALGTIPDIKVPEPAFTRKMAQFIHSNRVSVSIERIPHKAGVLVNMLQVLRDRDARINVLSIKTRVGGKFATVAFILKHPEGISADELK